jgi:multidrug efflux system membrane fusion protein
VLGEIDPLIYKAQYDQAVAKKAQDERSSPTRARSRALPAARASNAGSKQQADTQRAWSRSRRRWSRPTRPRSTMRRRRSATPRSSRRCRAAPACARSIRATSSSASDATGLVVITPAAADRGAVQPAAAADRARQRRRGKGALAVDVFGNDGVTVVDTGTLKGIDNQVDPTTGTLKLKAEFPNANSSSGRASSSTSG